MILLLAFVAIALSALYAFQRRLIYLPTRMSRADFDNAVERVLGTRTSRLAPFDAIVVEPAATDAIAGTAIFFHGNAGLGLDRAYLAPPFLQRRLRLILAEYPGYGARGGVSTQRDLVGDAAALYASVALRYPDTPLVLVGESLGSGVAVQVATQGPPVPPSRVVLITPFLSLAETAARAYRFPPLRYLVRDRFESEARLPRYHGTVAILVAGKDEVVGAAQGRALADVSRLRGATAYVELPEAGHNDWSQLIKGDDWTVLLGTPPVSSDRRPDER